MLDVDPLALLTGTSKRLNADGEGTPSELRRSGFEYGDIAVTGIPPIERPPLAKNTDLLSFRS